MKAKYLKIIATAIVTLHLSACGSSDTVNSGDVNETKIHRSFGVHYTEANQFTKITAGFRVGGSTGTTISLVSPSKVTVEDAELKLSGVEPEQNNSWGTSYGWQLSGTAMSSSYKFTWVKPSGKKTEDVVRAVVPYRMEPSLSKFSISQGIQIRLDRPISSTKTLVQATVALASQPDSSSREVSVATSGNVIYFEPRQLLRLTPGEYEVQLQTIVRSSMSASGEDLGGDLISTYALSSERVSILP